MVGDSTAYKLCAFTSGATWWEIFTQEKILKHHSINTISFHDKWLNWYVTSTWTVKKSKNSDVDLSSRKC